MFQGCEGVVHSGCTNDLRHLEYLCTNAVTSKGEIVPRIPLSIEHAKCIREKKNNKDKEAQQMRPDIHPLVGNDAKS